MIGYQVVSQVEDTWFDPNTNRAIAGIALTVTVNDGTGSTLTIRVPAATYGNVAATKALIEDKISSYEAVKALGS